MKKYVENWAVSVERMTDFFHKEYGVVFFIATGHSEYRTTINSTTVTLRPLPDNGVLIVPIHRTEITIEGPEDEATQIHHKFMMNFLSAGG